MVIDKWTRSQNNKSLSIPLLGHKSKETFSELKKEYERLQNLNHKFKNHRNSSSTKSDIGQKDNPEMNDITDLKDYIDKINSSLLSIDELINENNNFELEKNDTSTAKDIKSLINKILTEYNSFLINVKDFQKNNEKNNFNNFDINSSFYESEMFANKIKEKLKKDRNEDNIIEVQEPRTNEINRNIDRGHFNIITHRREFNNSKTIVRNNFEYTIEEDGFTYQIQFSLFFMIVLFLLFICYLCMP